MRRKGFTLIELMVVVAIILLLSGVILGALSAVVKRARATEARSDIDQLQTAWKAYLGDYREFPFSGTGKVVKDSDKVIQILRGGADHEDDTQEVKDYRKENPRGYSYIDIHPRSKGIFDPWGSFYQMAFDLSGNGNVENFRNGVSETVRSSVAIWSMGPDKTSGTQDDVLGWP